MARLTLNTAAWTEPGRRWPSYRGVICQQFAADMTHYAAVMSELLPPFVIEVGRAHGGTALFLADHMHGGLVISIDPKPATVDHENLLCIEASSTHPATIDRVEGLTRGERGLILLDGDHDQHQVAAELDVYAPMADYLIVEDTIMADLAGMETNGPHLALARWLPDHPEFRPDPDPSPTQHPGGWLRRIPGG
jgi:cephalosporin hydroxylase